MLKPLQHLACSTVAIFRVDEVEGGSGQIYRSHTGKKDGVWNDIQWEGAMCFGRRVEGKEVQPDLSQFVFVFMVQLWGCLTISLASLLNTGFLV
jgi:hypothetical protein